MTDRRTICYSMLMVKKSSHTKHITHNKTHILLKKGLVIYAILVFIAFVLLSLSAYTIHNIYIAKQRAIRYDRIAAIYDGFNLTDAYRGIDSNIFGEKRVYSWDNSRTYSSFQTYGHNDTVSNTYADLTRRIEAAGFKQFETAYAGSVGKQIHFRNDKGEYVRISVESAANHNSYLYVKPNPESLQTIDQESAPSYVTIKVNLDDNNE